MASRTPRTWPGCWPPRERSALHRRRGAGAAPRLVLPLPGDGELRLLRAGLLRLLRGACRPRRGDDPLDPVLLHGGPCAPRPAARRRRRPLLAAGLPGGERPRPRGGPGRAPPPAPPPRCGGRPEAPPPPLRP